MVCDQLGRAGGRGFDLLAVSREGHAGRPLQQPRERVEVVAERIRAAVRPQSDRRRDPRAGGGPATRFRPSGASAGRRRGPERRRAPSRRGCLRARAGSDPAVPRHLPVHLAEGAHLLLLGRGTPLASSQAHVTSWRVDAARSVRTARSRAPPGERERGELREVPCGADVVGMEVRDEDARRAGPSTPSRTAARRSRASGNPRRRVDDGPAVVACGRRRRARAPAGRHRQGHPARRLPPSDRPALSTNRQPPPRTRRAA